MRARYLFAGVVSTALLAAAVPASAATGWSVMRSPNAGRNHNQLNAVAASSPHAVWAVGLRYNGSSDRTLVERFSGGRWVVVKSPNASTGHNELDGVASLSARNAWAVGRAAPRSGQERTLVEHWNGRKWIHVSSPNEGTFHNELDAVSAGASGTVWAVGHFDTAVRPNDQTLVERYQHGKWAIVASPNMTTGPTVDHSSLVAVARVPGTAQMWAVGHYIKGTITQTLIEHYTGTKWVVAPSPDVSSTSHNELAGVVATGRNSAWAVGFSYNGKHDRTLVEHWNGKVWRIIKSPNANSNHNEFRSVTASNGRNVTAVGLYYSGHADRTLVEHWNGSKWTVIASPDAGRKHNELDGVSAVPHSSATVAVGLAFNGSTDKTLVERSGRL